MPPCSGCGYAVEWVRSARRSRWRLFAGRPDLITPGQYVRLPLDAPHLPIPHYFGSIAWSDAERPLPDQPLGELPDGYQWSSGVPALPPPPAVLVGDRQQFGGASSNAVRPLPLIGGWPKRCWAVVPTAAPLDRLDPLLRENWTAYAAILAAQYSDPNQAEALLRQLAGVPTSVARVDNGPSNYPGSLIGVYPDYTIVVMSGTTRNVQLALEGMEMFFGPRDFGLFSTAPLWWDFSTIMTDRIRDAGADPTKPIIIVGHSYGGASACILAARLRAGDPNRRITLLTYGSPKPGDSRLQERLFGLPQTHLVNVGDPVPWLSPSRLDFIPPLLKPPDYVLFSWERWRRPPAQTQLNSSGTTQPVEPGILSLADTISAVLATWWGFPTPDFPDHYMPEYLRRLTP